MCVKLDLCLNAISVNVEENFIKANKFLYIDIKMDFSFNERK